MKAQAPWVTSPPQEVLQALENHGATLTIDEEGLIVVEVCESILEEVNATLRGMGCALSNEPLERV